jgi:hypothetical protein
MHDIFEQLYMECTLKTHNEHVLTNKQICMYGTTKHICMYGKQMKSHKYIHKTEKVYRAQPSQAEPQPSEQTSRDESVDTWGTLRLELS